MYRFNILNNHLGVSILCHSLNDVAFCIIIERIDWNQLQDEDFSGFQKLIFNALQDIESDISIDQIPAKFADNLDQVLRKLNKLNNEYNGLNFIGVALTKEKVFVTSASYSRVHLIQDNKLIYVTRDHNFVSDLNSQLPTVSFEKNPEMFFAHTRTLGFEYPNKSPESVIWPVKEKYTILMCSDKYHCFKDPSEYINFLIDAQNITIEKDGKQNLGFLIKIEYIS